jgi:hypothetical protein
LRILLLDFVSAPSLHARVMGKPTDGHPLAFVILMSAWFSGKKCAAGLVASNPAVAPQQRSKSPRRLPTAEGSRCSRLFRFTTV